MKNPLTRNIRRLSLGVISLAFVTVAVVACGNHGGHEWGASQNQEQFTQMRDNFVERAGSKLELNSEQRKLLASVGDAMYDQRKAFMGQSADPRADIKAIISGAKFDLARAQALVNEKTMAIQSKSPQTLTALAAFYDSLNPEQQQKLRDMLESHRSWWHRG